MLGGVMKVQLAGKPPCCGERESFIESRRRMRGEIIDDQAHPLGVGKMDIHQLLHLTGKIPRWASGGDVDLTPAPQRLHEEQQIRRPRAAIVLVVASGLPRSGRQRRTDFPAQLHWTLSKTALR